jgi:hypothetical protein
MQAPLAQIRAELCVVFVTTLGGHADVLRTCCAPLLHPVVLALRASARLQHGKTLICRLKCQWQLMHVLVGEVTRGCLVASRTFEEVEPN